MLRTVDGMPVLEFPDGRTALADTGFSGLEILSNEPSGPVYINGREIQPVVHPVDLQGIAQQIGLEKLDLLIGSSLLHEGFSADFRGETFEFEASPRRMGEELVLALPYRRPDSGMISSPWVEFEIGGERVSAVFDTGAPYSLWKHRASEPDRAAEVKRTDFHVEPEGQLRAFPVLMRPESVRLSDVTLELDVAYLPETWPEYLPDCVLGMDVPEALGASRLVLEPESRELRFYRSHGGLEFSLPKRIHSRDCRREAACDRGER